MQACRPAPAGSPGLPIRDSRLISLKTSSTSASSNFRAAISFSDATAAANMKKLIRGNGDFVSVTQASQLPTALEEITPSAPTPEDEIVAKTLDLVDDLIREPVKGLMPRLQRLRMRTAVELRTLRDGDMVEYEYRLRHADGAVLRDLAGQLQGRIHQLVGLDNLAHESDLQGRLGIEAARRELDVLVEAVLKRLDVLDGRLRVEGVDLDVGRESVPGERIGDVHLVNHPGAADLR